MTTMRFTKAHEREEGRRLRKGFLHSCAGLALCWLPFVGLALAVSGFWRVLVRLTKRHRKKRAAGLVFSFLCLALCTGALLGEIWVYSRDPDILSRTGRQIWTFMVGEENAGVLSAQQNSGTLYEDMDSAGLGLTDTMGTENDSLRPEEDDLSAWEDDFDWEAWENDAFADNFTWSDEAWEDDPFWTEDEPAQDDPGAILGETGPAQGDLSAFIGESSSAQAENTMHMGKGERILPPTE